MGIANDIESVYEPDVKIKGKTFEDENVRQLWAKQQLLFRKQAEFWLPLVQIGKSMCDYAHGNIFDATTRAQYERVQGKVCIEPRVLKKRINGLVGQVQKAKRSGKVITEGGSSAERVYFANLILKYFENKIKEQVLLNRMTFHGCLTGYPQALWFDKAVTPFGDMLGGIRASILPWDSVVYAPGFEDPAGSDNHEITRMVRKTKRQLIDENPDMEDEIKEFFRRSNRDEPFQNYSSLLDATDGLTAEDARFLNFDILNGLSHSKMDGRVLVFDRLCPVKVKANVAIAKTPTGDATTDYQVLPPDWSSERKDNWMGSHPDYAMRSKSVTLLWNVRWTQNGLVLKNELDWFQEFNDDGLPDLRAALFTPQIIDGMPSGPGPDIKHLILMKAIVETEFLHDIRTGSGDVFAYKKGAVVNAEDIPTELSIGDGILEIDPDVATGNIEEHVRFLRRTANTTYGDYSLRVDDQLDKTDLMHAGVLGQHAPQQSGKAKNAEIAQVLIGYSFLAENYNQTFERIKNLECQLIPYAFTEEQILQCHDEDRQQDVPVQVNSSEYDLEGNEQRTPANDLTSAKWKWRLVDGDDSPTAREAELNEMLIFWNTTAPSLIDADETLSFLSSVLVSMSNRTAKEVGRVIAEKANANAQAMSQQQLMQQMAELEESRAKAQSSIIKAERSGFSFSITPEDLSQFPGLYPMLVQSKYINPSNGNQFQHPQNPQTAQPPQQPQAGPPAQQQPQQQMMM